MKQRKPWTIQWHIAADGTVIRQRSRGSEEHQQLFQRYAMTPTPQIEDIDAMVERLERASVSGFPFDAGRAQLRTFRITHDVESFTVPGP